MLFLCELQELTVLTERLSRLNEDLARKMQARNEFDQTIQETEAAYMKVRRISHCNLLATGVTGLPACSLCPELPAHRIRFVPPAHFARRSWRARRRC
jgi:hypothetical protein